MTTALMTFNKNPNIGLYGFATNKFVLVGKEVNKKTAKELERIFEVPVYKINIAGTSLIGVFIVGNEDLILVPSITFESELKQLDKLKIKYEVFKTDLTCLGNNIALSEHGALINPEFSDYEIKKIKAFFKVPVRRISIGETETPGSCIVLNKDQALIHRDTATKNIKLIEKILKVKAIPSTINMGVPYVKSGILCNEKGLVIGKNSGPAEVMNAEESLWFTE